MPPENEEQAFMDAFGAKLEAAQGAPPPEQAPDAPGPPPGAPQEGTPPQRDEQGRFVSREQAAEQEQERLYAGRFRSVEDLERAVQEQEQMIGRQSNEVGDLRRQLEQYGGQAPPEQPTGQEIDADWLDELIERDPFQAATMSRQANDPYAYHRVMTQWSEEDPAAARLYHQNAEMQARMAEQEQRIQQMMQPVQAQLAEDRLGQAWAAVVGRHPDAPQMADELAEAANSVPELATAMQQPGHEERALEQLYILAAGRRALNGQEPAPMQDQQPPMGEQRTAPQFVASATSSQPVGQNPADAAIDAFKAGFRQLANQRISLSEAIEDSRRTPST